MRTTEYGGRSYEVSDAHAATDKLPWDLDADDFAAMVTDMRASGFDRRQPVQRTPDGRLVNGRRRELAAKIAGAEPVYETVELTPEQIVEHVRRVDLHRRNLTPSQRAAVAVELAGLLPAHRPSEEPGNVAGLSQAAIAEQATTSERTVRDAAKVKQHAPELLPAVINGKLPVHTAARAADLPESERKKVAAAADVKKAAKEAIGRNTPVRRRNRPGAASTSGKPQHLGPFDGILSQITTLTAAITRAMNKDTPDAQRLRECIRGAEAGLVYAPDKWAADKGKAGWAFVALRGVRRLVRLANLSSRTPTAARIKAEYADAMHDETGTKEPTR
jgi:hypothetical protein